MGPRRVLGAPKSVATSAIGLLRKVGERVLVIDEINSVLLGTARQQRLFLQLLRFLANDLRLALVGVGAGSAACPAFRRAVAHPLQRC